MFEKKYTRLPTSESAGHNREARENLTWWRRFRRVKTSIVVSTLGICLGVVIAVVLAVSWQTRTAGDSLRPCESLKVRREWRDLSREEQKEYLRAVVCLRERPSRLGLNQSLYDDFPYFHARTGEDGELPFE